MSLNLTTETVPLPVNNGRRQELEGHFDPKMSVLTMSRTLEGVS